MGQSLSWLYPSSVPRLYTVTSKVQLNVKRANSNTETEPLSIAGFIQSRVPSLCSQFTPAWWLPNGHLQTGYCVAGDFSKIDKVVYDRTLIRLKDGGTLGLDSTPPLHERSVRDDAPIIVVMHGLTGGSHESYVRAVLAQAVKPTEEGGLGYRGIVINFRGCAGVPLTSDQLYSAGHTDDLRQALVYIARRYPDAPLLGLGFSLGANVIVRYLAEEGDQSRLRAGCALGCPWNLVENAQRIEDGFILRNVYSKGMGANLVNLLKRHVAALERLPPGHRAEQVLPKLQELSNPRLSTFDNEITSRLGGSVPPFPFASAKDYYTWASSHKCLPSVKVPLLAVNASDDPIVGHLPLDVGENGYVALAVTTHGGHLGWFESSGEGRWGVRRWITRPVLEWLKAAVEDLEVSPSKAPEIIEVGEWTTESGREHLGHKVLGDVGEIEGVEGEGGLLQGL